MSSSSSSSSSSTVPNPPPASPVTTSPPNSTCSIQIIFFHECGHTVIERTCRHIHITPSGELSDPHKISPHSRPTLADKCPNASAARYSYRNHKSCMWCNVPTGQAMPPRYIENPESSAAADRSTTTTGWGTLHPGFVTSTWRRSDRELWLSQRLIRERGKYFREKSAEQRVVDRGDREARRKRIQAAAEEWERRLEREMSRWERAKKPIEDRKYYYYKGQPHRLSYLFRALEPAAASSSSSSCPSSPEASSEASASPSPNSEASSPSSDSAPTENIQEKQEEEEEQEEDGCGICYQSLNDPLSRKLPCGHDFHVFCVFSWIVKNKSCPMCRQKYQVEEAPDFEELDRAISIADAAIVEFLSGGGRS